MRYFSYNEYVDYTENGGINKVRRVEEQIEEYELKSTKEKILNEENKIIQILKDKVQLKVFLNQFLNYFYIEDFEYLNNYNPKNNIMCKVKEKEIFIIVKVIQNIDNNISYKMLEDSISIIKEWEKVEEKSNKIRPIVIPIVIYIGKEKWKNNFCNKSSGLNYVEFHENRINFAYNLINIHELKIKNLKNRKSKFIKEIIKLKNEYLQINQ